VTVRASGRLGKWLVSGPPLLYLAIFFAIPTLIMVLASFRTPGEFGGLAPLFDEAGNLDLNMESYTRFFTESVYAEVFVKSFWYALVTTLLCLAIAYPLASLIATSQKRHRNLLLLLVILPFWSNFLIRIYAWMIILGPQAALAEVNIRGKFGFDPVSLLFSSFAVLTCLVYVHLPSALPLYANLGTTDMLDAAQDLGRTHGSASGGSRFRCRCPASTPVRRSSSSRHSGYSRSPTSWGVQRTASSATSSSSSSSRRATGRSAASCRSC
jgi:spermidine/putrescine transport system permease protein